MNNTKQAAEAFIADRLERKEAAALLGLTPDSFSVMQARGDLNLSYTVVGKRKRFYSRREILDLLDSRRVSVSAA